MCLGTVMVFSASAGRAGDAPWYLRTCLRQPIFAAAATVLMLLLWRVDYRRLVRPLRPGTGGWARHITPGAILLAAALAAAAATLVVGHAVGGVRRWIRFGPVGFQPSEAVKFSLLIFLAGMLGREGADVRGFRRMFLPAAGVTALSAALIVTQDFGTAAVLGIAAGGLMLLGGVRLVYLLSLLPVAALGFWRLVMCVPYRWARIAALIDPTDPTNQATYQGRQALYAIGSGVEPAGLGGGVAKHGYLPEGVTDFVFANACEELGWAGAVLLIGLLALWLVLAGRAAAQADDRFGGLLAGGIAFLVGMQAALHVAVNLGWAPPTGIPLPFVSAGGSSLLMMSAATGLIVSISSRTTVRSPEVRGLRAEAAGRGPVPTGAVSVPGYQTPDL